jgi:hypothetical protein
MNNLRMLHEMARRERDSRGPFAPPVITREQIFAALKRGAFHAKALQRQLEELRPTAETMALRLD